MYSMMINNRMNMNIHLAEDVNVPELRHPIHGGMRGGEGWLARLWGRRRAGACR